MVVVDITPSSRKELSFEWVAKYNNGTELLQFDNKEVEHHLRDVDLKKVTEFNLIGKGNLNKTLSVDLVTGLFKLNNEVIKGVGKAISKDDVLETSLGNKVRLIYYRRIQRDAQLNESNIDKLAVIETGLRQMYHFVGWEAWVNNEYERHEVAVTHQGNLYVPKLEKTINLF